MPTIISGDGTITGLTTTGISSVQKLPAGTVLQVVSTTKSNLFSASSTSFVDITGLSLSITPTNTSSKILLIVNIVGGSGVESASLCQFRLMRNSTPINVGDAASGYIQASVGGMRSPLDVNASWLCPMSFVDSPNTVSAITYKVQCSNESAAHVLRINSSGNDVSGQTWSHRSASTITAMEIAV